MCQARTHTSSSKGSLRGEQTKPEHEEERKEEETMMLDPAAMFVLVCLGLMASFALSGYIIDRYRMQGAKEVYHSFRTNPSGR